MRLFGPVLALTVTGHWSEGALVRRGTGPKGHWSECYGVGIHCREVVRIEAQQSKHSSLCKLGGY